MQKAFLTFGLFVIGLAVGGCATATRGTTQSISVSSTPSGADVTADGTYMGKTPVTMELKRNSDHNIVVGGSIYEPVTVVVKKQFNSAIAGNILIGRIIGVGVDAISGASYDLVPSSIHVPLERKKFAYKKEDDEYQY